MDPTKANNGGFNQLLVWKLEAGGALDLDPEESESWTVGFASRAESYQ